MFNGEGEHGCGHKHLAGFLGSKDLAEQLQNHPVIIEQRGECQAWKGIGVIQVNMLLFKLHRHDCKCRSPTWVQGVGVHKPKQNRRWGHGSIFK